MTDFHMNETAGTVLGAVAGGIIGASIGKSIGISGGFGGINGAGPCSITFALIGGLAGNRVGHHVDEGIY